MTSTNEPLTLSNYRTYIYVRNPKTVATPIRIYTYTDFAIEILGFNRRLTDTLRYHHTRCSRASGLLAAICQHAYQIRRKVEFTRSCPLFFCEFWKITIIGTSSINRLPLEYNGELYGFYAVKVKLVDSLI